MPNSFDPTYGNYDFDGSTFTDPMTGEIYDTNGVYIGSRNPTIGASNAPSNAYTIIAPDAGGGYHPNIWITPDGSTGGSTPLVLPSAKTALTGNSTSLFGDLFGTDDMAKYLVLMLMMNSKQSDNTMLMYMMMFGGFGTTQPSSSSPFSLIPTPSTPTSPNKPSTDAGQAWQDFLGTLGKLFQPW